MSGGNDTVSEVKVGRKFEVEALCEGILEKVRKLKEDLEPVLRRDDGTTPETRDGSPLIMQLQAIDGYLEQLIASVDL